MSLIRDVRYGLRGLRRNPAFTTVAILTLALGIGANTAIFSVVNAALIRPLDYAAPDELVFVHSQFPAIGFDQFWISPPEYRELQREMRSFGVIGAWRTGAVSLSGGDRPTRVTAAIASAELFETLGVAPRLGRVYTREEDLAGAEPVALISHRLWQSAFGGETGMLGRTVDLDGEATTLVGVMPPGFDVRDAGVDVWMPLGLPENPTNRGSHYLDLIARLAPGATFETASAELAGLVARWQDEVAGGAHAPTPDGHAIVAKQFHEHVVGAARPALLMLLGAVGFLLLIACANVANLLLARAESRQKEVALRAALGARRGRLLRQFLTESLVLSAAGGVAGLLLGYWGVEALVAMSPDSVPRSESVRLDGTVLGFTLAVALVTGLLFGLAPLLHLSERFTGTALRSGGRSTATARRQRLRRLLVVAEVGLAVILVIGSALMLRSFGALRAVEPGFEPGSLLTFQTYLPQATYPAVSDRAAFLDRLIVELEALPGVTAAAAMAGLPPVRDVNANTTAFDGQQVTPEGTETEVDYYQSVTAGYFEAMGIPIIAGRNFTAGDDAAGAPVVVINETLARLFYPDENPLGRRIRPSWVEPWFEIIGVAGDVKQSGLSEPTGSELYFHYPQVVAGGFSWSPRTMNLVVRTTRPPLTLVDEVRQRVWRLDDALAVAELQTMEANLAGSLDGPRFLSLLLTLFAALALTLAGVGTYGVLAHTVAERRRDIGIRMALGAGRRGVIRTVLRDGLAPVALGLGLGVVGALALTRFLSSLLFGVGSLDLPAFLIAPGVLVLVSVAACYLPALSATRVDPMATLRTE